MGKYGVPFFGCPYRWQYAHVSSESEERVHFPLFLLIYLRWNRFFLGVQSVSWKHGPSSEFFAAVDIGEHMADDVDEVLGKVVRMPAVVPPSL